MVKPIRNRHLVHDESRRPAAEFGNETRHALAFSRSRGLEVLLRQVVAATTFQRLLTPNPETKHGIAGCDSSPWSGQLVVIFATALVGIGVVVRLPAARD